MVGDAMLDVYVRGDADRVSPEAPVPVVRVRERRDALGGAANVAQNVCALGQPCTIVAAAGDDPSGRRLRELLVATSHCTPSLVTVQRPTTTKTRILARAQQLLRLDDEDDADLAPPDAARLVDAAIAAIDGANAVVLEDYNKGVLTPPVISAVLKRAAERNVPVVVDPKYRHFFAYRGARIFKPNRRELEAALGAAVDLDHPEALRQVLDRLGCDTLLLTRGEHGMTLISSGTRLDIPTTARDVYDVVGAGDTVTAYLAVMLAAGATVSEAAIVANFAAGVQVGKVGAQVVTAAEVLDAYQAAGDEKTKLQKTRRREDEKTR